MLLQRKFQIAAAVVVMRQVTRDGEDAARLALEAGAEQGREGKGLVIGIFKLPNVPRNAVEKAKIFGGKKDPGKGALDEVMSIGCFADQDLDRFAVEALITVLDRCAGDDA